MGNQGPPSKGTQNRLKHKTTTMTNVCAKILQLIFVVTFCVVVVLEFGEYQRAAFAYHTLGFATCQNMSVPRSCFQIAQFSSNDQQEQAVRGHTVIVDFETFVAFTIEKRVHKCNLKMMSFLSRLQPIECVVFFFIYVFLW